MSDMTKNFYPEHIKNAYKSVRTMGKILEETLQKEDIQMTIKHMKNC